MSEADSAGTQDKAAGGESPRPLTWSLLDAEELRGRLLAMARLGRIPVALYLLDHEDWEDATEGQFLMWSPSRLDALIDSSSRDTRPVRRATLELCRSVVTAGADRHAVLPGGDWALRGWPIVVGSGTDGFVLGCLAAGQPVSDARVPDLLLAARFDLEPAAVTQARAPEVTPEVHARVQAVHRELRAVARDQGRLATETRRGHGLAPPLAPRRTSTGMHRVHTLGVIQPLLNAMLLEAVWVIDAKGQVRQANNACSSWFGPEHVGRSCDGICQSPSPPCALCPRTRPGVDSHQAGTVRRHELTISGRALDVTVYPLRIAGEEEPGALLVARDVTTRQKLKKSLEGHAAELAERRQQLQAILDCMGEGLVVTDAAGIITLANPSTRLLFGLTPADLEGRHIMGLLPREPKLVESWEELIGGRVERFQTEVRIRGYQVSDLLVAFARMPGADGQTRGFVATMKDITRLKELDRLRNDFVSNVSHELRTPLATVRGFVKAIRADVDMPEVSRTEFLQLIDREADRLGHLIEDMLGMARLESEPGASQRKPIELTECAAHVLEPLEARAAERGLKLELALDQGPIVVLADAVLLRQLVNNLLSNALKFTPVGGIVRFAVEGDGAVATLRVSDNGPGIAESELPYIFDKFYRAPRTARTTQGTGLGMAIVKGVVDAHGWHLGLRSSVDEGTEVWVEIPIAAGLDPPRDG